MKKLKLLIILMMMSFISFSQNDTDSTSIRLEKPIVKLVIKDLITGDEAKETLTLTETKINLLENKVNLKDSVIVSLETKIGNFESIMDNRSKQLSLSEELSKRLQADLKKQKLRTKLMGGAGILVAVGVAILVK
tara:strand:- start:109 stop:513 length:405 start_codon:yes stop_codon:yes gene_type:complete